MVDLGKTCSEIDELTWRDVEIFFAYRSTHPSAEDMIAVYLGIDTKPKAEAEAEKPTSLDEHPEFVAMMNSDPNIQRMFNEAKSRGG